MSNLNRFRISELYVRLENLIDCREITSYGVPLNTLLDDFDYTFTQQLGATAISMGAEGLIVPSATRLGDNLVVFPENLLPKSRLEVIASRDPVLYVERENTSP